MATNPHAYDSWLTYITSITTEKCSSAYKYSKENGLNKSATIRLFHKSWIETKISEQLLKRLTANITFIAG